MSWDEVTHAFFAAAEAFDRLLEAPEVTARWEEPSALDGYTVGAIVGHVNAALAWTEPMLDTPEPSDLRPIRLGNYYADLKITEEARHPIHDMRPAVPAAVRLDDFLRTRVVELVVHGDDLAASVALDPVPASTETTSVAMEVLLHTARAAHGDLAVIRALARKERTAAGVFPVF